MAGEEERDLPDGFDGFSEEDLMEGDIEFDLRDTDDENVDTVFSEDPDVDVELPHPKKASQKKIKKTKPVQETEAKPKRDYKKLAISGAIVLAGLFACSCIGLLSYAIVANPSKKTNRAPSGISAAAFEDSKSSTSEQHEKRNQPVAVRNKTKPPAEETQKEFKYPNSQDQSSQGQSVADRTQVTPVEENYNQQKMSPPRGHSKKTNGGRAGNPESGSDVGPSLAPQVLTELQKMSASYLALAQSYKQLSEKNGLQGQASQEDQEQIHALTLQLEDAKRDLSQALAKNEAYQVVIKRLETAKAQRLKAMQDMAKNMESLKDKESETIKKHLATINDLKGKNQHLRSLESKWRHKFQDAEKELKIAKTQKVKLDPKAQAAALNKFNGRWSLYGLTDSQAAFLSNAGDGDIRLVGAGQDLDGVTIEEIRFPEKYVLTSVGKINYKQ